MPGVSNECRLRDHPSTPDTDFVDRPYKTAGLRGAFEWGPVGANQRQANVERLKGKRALITGGTSGIGLEAALAKAVAEAFGQLDILVVNAGERLFRTRSLAAVRKPR